MLSASAANYLERLHDIRKPQQELLSELGDLGVKEICDLFFRLIGEPPADSDAFYYRTTCSLISHGEAQLFALSDPRFAFRIAIYRRGKTVAILNIRRIARLLDQMHNIKPERVSAFRRMRGPIDRRKLSVLADSLLSIPEKYLNQPQWIIGRLPTKVAKHYGHESGPNDFEIYTIPYIRPLELISGGACAQACCWMADHFGYSFDINHPIHSLPEITWLARENGERPLSLSGLSIIEMFRYYNRPESGFRLSNQFHNATDLTRETMFGLERMWRPVALAIKAYLRSKLPVLMLVDANRMKGRGHSKLYILENIYAQNGYQLDRPVPTIKNKFVDARHMIILFGFDRTSNDVVFNDPAIGPFLKTDVRNLFDAGCYMTPSDLDDFKAGDFLQPPSFLAVAPAKVKIQLLRSNHINSHGEHVTQDGLLAISRDCSWPAGMHFANTSPQTESRDQAIYLLTRIDQVSVHATELKIDRPRCAEILKELPDKLMLNGWSGRHWVWLDLRHATLYVWDAQADPARWDRPGSERLFLIACSASDERGTCKWEYGNALPTTEEPTSFESRGNESPFRLGGSPELITSFAPMGLVTAKEAVRSVTNTSPQAGHLNLDLYLYQRTEAFELLPKSSLWRTSMIRWLWRKQFIHNTSLIRNWLHLRPEIDRNATKPLHWRSQPRPPIAEPDISICEWLSAKCDDMAYIQLAAARIVKSLPPDVKCKSVTTFLPEITSGSPARAKRGIRALRFVANLVSQLNQFHHAQIRCIKIVAGSLIDHIKWDSKARDSLTERTKDGNIFHASRLSKKDGHDRLLKALRTASHALPPNVTFAIELEPGPIGIISTMDDLILIHNKLGQFNQIGFNCNICHYILSRIDPDELLRDLKGPISRIVSFNCSDSGHGHFHDLVLGRCRKEAEFKKWNKVVEIVTRNAIDKGTETPPFSVEIERAAGISMVSAALDSVNRIFFT